MTNNEIVFMMGLPAAGKSTVSEARFASTHTLIDADLYKTQHPEYDPMNAHKVHDWSLEKLEQAFDAAIASRSGRYVLDGTGVNAEAMVRRMTEAKLAGFHVHLLYVKCTLQTSLRRVRSRVRKVPEAVIREKARNIATSFELIAPYADEIEVVNNDQDIN